MIGIYKIENLINKKLYIGQSINIKRRWSYHKSKLKRNVHWNPHLQSAWNKYGEENFKFEKIEDCTINLLDEKEKYWCDLYESFKNNNGYNLTVPIGYGRYNITDSGRKALSKAHKGKIISKELRDRISKGNLGKKLSDETKMKMSIAKKGQIFSEDSRSKMSSSRKLYLKNNPITNNPNWVKARIKKVYSLNIITLEEKEYNSQKEAAFDNKHTNPNYISSCCINIRYTTGFCVWAFKKEDLIDKLSRIPKKVVELFKNKYKKLV